MPACMSEDEPLGDVLPATPVVPNVLYTVYEVFDPDWNFHEVAQNAIEGATATVRGSMDQLAMTGQGYEAGWPR